MLGTLDSSGTKSAQIEMSRQLCIGLDLLGAKRERPRGAGHRSPVREYPERKLNAQAHCQPKKGDSRAYALVGGAEPHVAVLQ